MSHLCLPLSTGDDGSRRETLLRHWGIHGGIKSRGTRSMTSLASIALLLTELIV